MHNMGGTKIEAKDVVFYNQRIHGKAYDNSNQMNNIRVLDVSSFKQNFYTYESV